MYKINRTALSLAFVSALALTGCNSQQDKQKAAAEAASAASATAAKQAEAAKQAAIAQQQIDATEAEKEHAAAFQKQVEQNKKKSKAMNKGSKTWTTYLP